MNLEQYREENELLWNEVLDNSEWFVSPRGDSYSRDEELRQNHGIASLGFQIDRAFPREHRVVMNLQGIDEPFVIWLSTRRQLLDAERRPLVANIGLREVFLNSVLRRLFSITAKLYGTYGGHERGESGVWGYMYRRAHYTVLTSEPPRRVYTMQSIQARTHAADILEDYGVNIYGETARRRAIHRLGENQFLTFHRESNPDIPSWIPEPNELVYNPARVQEAIQDIRAGRHPHQA